MIFMKVDHGWLNVKLEDHFLYNFDIYLQLAVFIYIERFCFNAELCLSMQINVWYVYRNYSSRKDCLFRNSYEYFDSDIFHHKVVWNQFFTGLIVVSFRIYRASIWLGKGGRSSLWNILHRVS